ncbi:hypothetical protein EDD16DRAFT_1761229 [Pisolithus croceorrhizus]|nr:hypothetical protein EDD16DRAFT_1761229 [Pisolithus croceorrhizus]KAI6107492.1 hypothetical protein EV401DRAFT_2213130 [Pisolithus croceorrhizus]KAI6165557.1 hypothetical protein EDD17DRAFT_1793481 [Pisolithus thermaeus]
MSSPTVPSSSHVLNACNRLMGSPSYLGLPSLSSDFHWLCEGRGHVLIHMPESPPDTVTTTSPPTNSDDGDPCDSSPNVPSTPVAVSLSAIIRINREDFWLTSDGGYQGPGAVWRDILDVKPSCTVSNPSIEPVTSDFVHMLRNLHLLTKRCVTPGFSSGKSFFCADHQAVARFKLRHRLFEAVDMDADSEQPNECPTAPFTFEHWPLTKEKNRAELLALKNSHCLLPVPAYDVAGFLIAPSAYRCCLQGAIAEVHFTLSHWGIAAAKRNVYGSRIVFIRVLVLPPPLSATCKKRKLPLHINSDETPPYKYTRV